MSVFQGKPKNLDVPADANIVVFGAGVLGTFALHALKIRGLDVRCFCDNNPEKQKIPFHGLPVVAPDRLKSLFPEPIVYIASVFIEGMSRQLATLGFTRIYDCTALFESFDVDGLETELPQAEIVRLIALYQYTVLGRREGPLIVKCLDVVVSERCSLRCRDCANLMQYYQTPKDCDVDRMFAAIDAFLAVIEKLYEFRVLGGEPFLSKNLPQILDRLTTYEKCEQVLVLTNGTIVPKKQTLRSLQNKKICVQITNYGPLSRKYQELVALFDERKISYVVVKTDHWQDCGKIELQQRTPMELRRLFMDCCANDLLTLLHGQLYRCPFAAHAENLKAIPPFDGDSIDLLAPTDHESLRGRLVDFYRKTNSIEACRYCLGRDSATATVPAAIQAEKPLSYRTVEEKQ